MSIVECCKAASSGRIKATVAALLFTYSATLFAWQEKKEIPPPKGAHPAPAKPAPAAPVRPAPANQANRPATPGPRPATPGARPNNPGARPNTPAVQPAAAGVRPAGTGFRPAPPGGREVHTAGGGVAHFDSRGRVQEVHARGMDIRRGPGGVHRVERVGPGGTVVVTNGAGHGYVQRPFSYGGRTYVQRTYYVRGVPYTRAYRSYYYGGVSYGIYAPARFYAPGFYGWAFAPWGVPVVYNFGWYGSPWYGYYGGYYTPYPVYSTPTLWLTDYYMGSTMQAAYQERNAEWAAQNAQAPPPPPPDNQVALSPEVKQMIADEVQRQLQAERNDAARTAPNAPPSDPPPAVFTDNTPHVFVVASGLNVSSQGQPCPVTEGDVLETRGALPTNSPTADAVMLASKGQDCAKGSVVSVAVQDLVDMQNHMRETLDQGLGELQSKQGQGGLPAVPASYMAPPTQANFVTSAPPPEQNIADELSKQAREANQAEQEIVTQALAPSGSTPPPGQPPPAQPAPVAPAQQPAEISLGQSPAEVEAILGPPKQAINAGPKKIYIYKDLKITFLNGKVSDVQ